MGLTDIGREDQMYFQQLPPGSLPGPTRAPHIGHSNHLCDMAERGDVSLSQMKDLVRNPNFVCSKCGRTAKNSDNLCAPVSLDYSCGMCGESFSSKAKLMEHAKSHK